MAKLPDLSKLDEGGLLELSYALEKEQAEFDAEIRERKLAVQDELSKLARRRRLASLTKEERMELAAMAAEDENDG